MFAFARVNIVKYCTCQFVNATCMHSYKLIKNARHIIICLDLKLFLISFVSLSSRRAAAWRAASSGEGRVKDAIDRGSGREAKRRRGRGTYHTRDINTLSKNNNIV